MKLLVLSNYAIVAALLSAGNVFAQSVEVTNTATSTTTQTPTMPATTRSQAHDQAKSESGRVDPLAPVTGFKHFPSHDANFVPPGQVVEKSKLVPIKSEVPKTTLSSTNPYLKIPPPPGDVSAYSVGSSNELPVSELPEPPERPSLLNSIKLTGIVGNKAIFAVTDARARLRNGWPKALTLAPGDHFEGVSVVSVDAQGAVLEEDGARVDVHLERIR